MGMMLIMFVPMLLVIFLLNRSQGKKQKELESKLKKGDRVLVAGGLVGKIAELGSKYAKIEIAPGVKVQMLKTAIQGLDTGDESSTSASAKDGGKDKSESSKDENK
jgi:preprotein translocase subunit YajC